MNRRLISVIILFTGVVLACSDSSDDVVNPFDGIDYGDTLSTVSSIDTLSIVGLHQNIFKARCSIPGCHDGAFEPDFRTVQSTYSTLVYHPVTKNNAENGFSFRVVPFESDKSVLIERLTNCCFVNENDRMPQDNIGVPLEEHYVESIRQWIDKGAKDIFDMPSTYPNTEARILYYVPFNEDYTTNFGENRLDGYRSFIVPRDVMVNFLVVVEDDSTAVEDLIHNRIVVSTDIDDFSGGTILDSYVVDGQNSEKFYVTELDAEDFPVNETLYFRVYTNDGKQEKDTEFPSDEQQLFYKIFYSFIIQ